MDDDLGHYGTDDAEGMMGYQRLAWFATPAGVSGLWLLVLAFFVNQLCRFGREVVRLVSRSRLV